MPKKIVELAQGNAFSRSSDGGGAAYQATRKWKVLLNSPGENWDIAAAVGVNIGDEYGDGNSIPCVSLDMTADSESRLVRIVTATYRTSPSAAPDAADPKTLEPTVRPALYSMSTSLTEIAAWGGAYVTNGSSVAWGPAVNPVGDLVDGITRLEPVVNISIDQYSYGDASGMLAYTGYVNSDTFAFSDMTVLPHCCMLQSVASQPVVEQFGQTTFRGFKTTFGFAVRAHWTFTRDGFQPVGWDMAVPQTGFNVLNSGTTRADVDKQALTLQHEDGKVKFDAANGMVELAENLTQKKTRAMVSVPAHDGGWLQRPSAQPVALNDDGTPRNADNFSVSQKVLINRICIQPEMDFGDNFSSFGIRWFA